MYYTKLGMQFTYTIMSFRLKQLGGPELGTLMYSKIIKMERKSLKKKLLICSKLSKGYAHFVQLNETQVLIYIKNQVILVKRSLAVCLKGTFLNSLRTREIQESTVGH